MAFNVNEYWAEIAQKAGLTAEQITGVDTMLQDEAVAKAFNGAFVNRPDVDRALDKRGQESRDTALAEAKVGYDDWYHKEALPRLNSLNEQIRQYETQFGPLGTPNPNTPPARRPANPPANGEGNLTQAQLQESILNTVNGLLKDRDAATVNLWEDGLTIVDDWRRRFPAEAFPTTEFREFAERNNLRPGDAYEKFIAPRVEDGRVASHKQELEDAKAEAVRDYVSKHGSPVDSAPREPAPFFTPKETPGEGEQPAGPLTDKQKQAMFTESWRESAPKD
jgi:hypothetical protein